MIRQRAVGSWMVTAIGDGYLELPPSVMTGMSEGETKTLMAKQPGSGIHTPVNAFLLQGEGRTVLIDAGSGSMVGPTAGRFLANLAAAGVQPGEVDLVLLTHLHSDHFGGLVTEDGAAVFPRAELALAADEATFWLSEEAASSAPEGRRPTVIASQAAVAPYRERLRSIEGTDAAPAITRVALPGHTPGHSGFRVGDGTDALLIWGDVMHVPSVQASRPEVGLVFDTDPAEAIATRQRVLDMVASERLAVAGMHLGDPTFSHVVRRGAGYELVPAP